jgi:hypothetical protein
MSKRKAVAIISILMILITLIPTGFAAEATDVTVSMTTISSNKIENGDSFNLGITISNKTNQTIKIKGVRTQDSSFQITSLSASISGDLEDNGVRSTDLILTYFGGKKDLIIAVDYDINGTPYTARLRTAMPAVPVWETDDNADASKDYAPNVIVDPTQTIPTLTAGRANTITIGFVNDASYEAKNIKIEPQILGIANSPFEAKQVSIVKNIAELKADQYESVSFSVDVKGNAPSGQVIIPIKGTYENAFGDEFPLTINYYVKVQNSNAMPVMAVQSVKLDKGTLNAGTTDILRVTLKNTGSLQVKNLSARISGFTANGIQLNNAVDTQFIKQINGGQVAVLSFPIAAYEKIITGNQSLNLSFTYEDAYGKAGENTAAIFVPVEGESATSSDGNAYLMLESYDFGGDAVTAGESFDLTVRFQNSNTENAIENTVVTISSEDGIFMPVQSSNSFYIEKLDPKEFYEHTFTLSPSRDAKYQSYKVNFNITPNHGIESPEISIPVIQEMRLKIQEPSYLPHAEIGMRMDYDVDFYNTGRTTLYNLAIRAEGNFEMPEGSDSYIGNLNSGSSNYYSLTLVPSEEKVEGVIYFDYEDAVGGNHTKEMNVSLLASLGMEEGDFSGGEELPPDFEGGMEPPIDGKSGMPLWGYGIIGVVALGAVVIIVKKRKAKKAEEELDLDE